MHMIRKLLIGLLSLLALILLVLLLFFRLEGYRLYKVLTLFSPPDISWNFKNATSIFPSSAVPRSAHPLPFAAEAQARDLPKTFSYEGAAVDTQDYLRSTFTDALLVLHRGQMNHEYYGNGFTQQDHHLSWSVSKSIISALFGIAVEDGKIKSIEQNVTDYLPGLAGTGYDHVRIKDVLQMSSGVAFNEDYADFNSDINVFGRYFALGTPLAKFIERLKREHEPGTFNHYVSMDTQVLGMILTKATGRSITDYMNEKLWSPLGAESEAYWNVDSTGMEFAFGGLNATARDYAKVGQLYLDRGTWQGKQLVPQAWVKASVTPDAPHLMPGKRANALRKEGYGYQWWIPLGSKGEFSAQGVYGQYIYVDPKHDVVIVKLSSHAKWKDQQEFTRDHDYALFRRIAEQFDERP